MTQDTSAYWAATPTVAKKRLENLRSAGLKQLAISWDDYHELQSGFRMSFDFVRNACESALDLKLGVGINITRTSKSAWTADRVKDELGSLSSDNIIIVESWLNKTGRALNECHIENDVQEQRFGPCPYVLRGPTLGVTGKLQACCGVSPEMDSLVIDSAPAPETLLAKINTASLNPLLLWLHLEGPYAILRALHIENGTPMPEPSDLGGNCGACRHLLGSDKRLIEQAKDLAERNKKNLMNEAAVLDAFGLLNEESDLPLHLFWQ